MRLLLESELESKYTVEIFGSGESCLSRLSEKQPNLFLIDVGLPGINGYDLCRKIKEIPEIAGTPVLFISNYDKLDDVLAGYDAGGEDYIVKPFDVVLLGRKIEYLLQKEQSKKFVLDKAKSSDELASLVLANLDEYAVLIRFLRSLNDCEHPRVLTSLMFGVLDGYGLEAAIQLRLPGLEFTISKDGENRPLEVAVISHVRSMDRIFEFKKRAAYNFDCITILVNNMPIHNPELCGRIRDNLLIAVECANAKLHAVQTKAENTQSKATATNLLEALRCAVADFETKYSTARYRGTVLTQEMLDELASACASLGLSDDQENRIDSIIRIKTSVLTEVFDFSNETQAALNDIAAQLAAILIPTTTSVSALSMDTPSEMTSKGLDHQSVELF